MIYRRKFILYDGISLICARRESNPYFQLRRLTLYPLNYGRVTTRNDISIILNYLSDVQKLLRFNQKNFTLFFCLLQIKILIEGQIITIFLMEVAGNGVK